ncbi:MAG TPA: DUF58 domain-containing protein [Gammaproteobacteria bacterium]|nr:DUF58 domain-containing protein [Gammaproteobacteria bacterium]
MNLTTRSYALAIFIVALALLGEWGPALFAGLWKLPTAAVIILLWLERNESRRLPLELTRVLPETVCLGRPFDNRILINNPNEIEPQLEILDLLPGGIADQPALQRTRLRRRDDVLLSQMLTPVETGILKLNALRGRLRGRFGLAWWRRDFQVPAETRVLPDRLHSHEFYLSTQRGGSEHRKLTVGGGQELLGMRDYQHGDPLHLIDWKATARSGRTTVRVMTEDQHLEVVIVIDAGRTSAMQAGVLTRLGHYSNVAARLAEKALLNGDYVSLVSFSDRVINLSRQQRGHAGLRQIRQQIEDLSPVMQESNPLAAIMQVRQLIRHRSLVVILTDLDDADASGQLVQAVSMLRPRHLPVVATILDDETMALQYQSARSWLDPWISLAAQETVQEWQRTRLQLEHLGVPVVMASAEQLDAAILGSYEQLRARHQI